MRLTGALLLPVLLLIILALGGCTAPHQIKSTTSYTNMEMLFLGKQLAYSSLAKGNYSQCIHYMAEYNSNASGTNDSIICQRVQDALAQGNFSSCFEAMWKPTYPDYLAGEFAGYETGSCYAVYMYKKDIRNVSCTQISHIQDSENMGVSKCVITTAFINNNISECNAINESENFGKMSDFPSYDYHSFVQCKALLAIKNNNPALCSGDYSPECLTAFSIITGNDKCSLINDSDYKSFCEERYVLLNTKADWYVAQDLANPTTTGSWSNVATTLNDSSLSNRTDIVNIRSSKYLKSLQR